MHAAERAYAEMHVYIHIPPRHQSRQTDHQPRGIKTLESLAVTFCSCCSSSAASSRAQTPTRSLTRVPGSPPVTIRRRAAPLPSNVDCRRCMVSGNRLRKIESNRIVQGWVGDAAAVM